MTRPLRVSSLLLGAMVAIGGSAHAQDRPVVLVHGFASSGDTWLEASVRLKTQLAVETYRPDTSWQTSYEHQAAQVQASMGARPGTTIALGHSNGGLVAREWSKTHPLSGIVTLSTPNAGAPLTNNFFNWLELNLNAFGIINGLSSSFANPNEGSWWVYGVIQGALQLAAGSASDAIFGMARLGVDGTFPVFPQQRVGSPFLQAMNGGANLAREAAQVPRRISIVNTVSDPGTGGIFRAIFPDQSDAINTAIWVASSTLDVWAVSIAATGGARDLERAGWMWSLAGWLRGHERLWCNTISDPTPYAYSSAGQCWENDTVVPVWSQQFPGGVSIPVRNSPVHIRQTVGMNATLYEVLTSQFGIPPRGPGGTSGSPTVLMAGQALSPGQELWSPDRRYRLTYQVDGNLVLYRYDGVAAWSSGTYGRSANTAYMQNDGNFVVYDKAIAPVWHAGTYGNPGAYLLVNNSGTISIASAAGVQLWSSPQPPWNVTPGPGGGGGGGGTGADTLTAGARLYPGQAVSSTDRRFSLTYQTDGNLVLYGPGGTPRWSTQTFSAAGYAEMQVDGNFVAYAANGTPIWASNTSGQLNARLVVHNDGNVVIYTASGLSSWATNTGGS